MLNFDGLYRNDWSYLTVYQDSKPVATIRRKRVIGDHDNPGFIASATNGQEIGRAETRAEIRRVIVQHVIGADAKPATLADITTVRDADGLSLRPHSAAANDFLAAEFASYGDADLTPFDIDMIQEKAVRAGFIVRNSLGQIWPGPGTVKIDLNS